VASTARRKAFAAAVAIAASLAVVTAGCGGSVEVNCADSILVDWNNGRLGSTYAPQCYHDALEALPEDVRIYTSAPEEIMRALRGSLAARALRRESGNKTRREQAAAGTDRPSRQLSGGRRERKPAPQGGEAETTAAPAPGAVTAPTSLPLPILFTVLLILAVSAGGATSFVARRVRVRRVRRGASGPL
jgi:hypothetical protein